MRRHNHTSLSQCSEKDGRLYNNDRLWIYANPALCAQLIRGHHDAPVAGHPGRAKTYELLFRRYYWPKMTSDISRWTQNCHVCHRSKSTRDHLHGTVKHLPVPERPWTDISVDFITDLEKSSEYDAIMVVVDRLSKMRHFIPCHTKCSAAATAKLFVDHVWKLHGLPSSVISDCGPQYVSRFWRYLAKRLSISAKLSRSYHPQTDSQTERLSPETKSLRSYRSAKVKFLIVPTLPPRLPILAQFWLSHRNVGHKSSRKLQIQGSERTPLATH